MLTGISGPSFSGMYHKIKCTDATQAKQLMAKMQTALKTTDYLSGTKGDEIIIKTMQNTRDVKAMMQCMGEVNKPKSTTVNAIGIYKKFDKKYLPPPPEVNVRL